MFAIEYVTQVTWSFISHKKLHISSRNLTKILKFPSVFFRCIISEIFSLSMANGDHAWASNACSDIDTCYDKKRNCFIIIHRAKSHAFTRCHFKGRKWHQPLQLEKYFAFHYWALHSRYYHRNGSRYFLLVMLRTLSPVNLDSIKKTKH